MTHPTKQPDYSEYKNSIYHIDRLIGHELENVNAPENVRNHPSKAAKISWLYNQGHINENTRQRYDGNKTFEEWQKEERAGGIKTKQTPVLDWVLIVIAFWVIFNLLT